MLAEILKKQSSVIAYCMTYILGARCRDGVVIVAERKFTINYGADYEYDSKMVGEIGGTIVGFSGGRRTFELYRTEIRTYVRQYQEDHGTGAPRDEFVLKNSEIMSRLYNRFHNREDNFDALIGLTDNPSKLKYFYPDGGLEPVNTYKAIGSGEPYGSIFLKNLYNPTKSMEEVAEIGYFIIKYIEAFQLDLTVGVSNTPPNDKPEVWFIPDGIGTGGLTTDHHASSTILDNFEERTKERLKLFGSHVDGLFTKKV
jgi:20S proteasome alpha/beta subunit